MQQFLPPGAFDWLDEKGISLHRATPGTVIPSHRDEYTAYRSRLGISNVNRIVRAVVFLEDCRPGHYLGVADRAFSSWRAGDWVAWFGSVPHTVANLGSQDRYTMTVTGISKL
jgi:aspartyl/asparaginyl beta-hydroxylase (cupin superfamily)